MAFTVTLYANGRQFSVAADESILEGARRAGLALPYSCLSGVCGSCKASVISGTVHYPRNPPQALDSAEQAQHDVLLCQAVALSDLSLAAREVVAAEDIPCRKLQVEVVAKTLLAPDVMCVDLRALSSRRLRWLPGQYVDVLLDDGKRRAFSIANNANAEGRMQLHVRHVAGGGFTAWVFNDMQPGMRLHIEGPLGTFVPREDSERPMIFVAGGTGFAPIKAIVEHFMQLGTARPMHLYWGARNLAELYLRELPTCWAAQSPTLSFHAVLADPQAAAQAALRSGMVHTAVLDDFPDLSPFDVYVCGPPALIDAARHTFAAAGLGEDHLYFDSFEYAPDVIAAILRRRAGIGAK
ncbi:MAG: FAD-binding oxidoreductase [Xanthomonadales bacterium]|nr:FAD-binding oxidoreductase [Xanthomonadales bacterium]